MSKLLLITLFCSFLISVIADNDKLYLFSIRYKSNGTNVMSKSDLKSVEVTFTYIFKHYFAPMIDFQFNNRPIIDYNFAGDPQSGASIILSNVRLFRFFSELKVYFIIGQ